MFQSVPADATTGPHVTVQVNVFGGAAVGAPMIPIPDPYLDPSSAPQPESAWTPRIVRPDSEPGSEFHGPSPVRGSEGEHRIHSPVRSSEGEHRTTEDWERQFEQRELSPDDRAGYAACTSLRQFYDAWVESEHQRRVAAGKLAKATYNRYRQALAVWERFAPRPPRDQPDSEPWTGLPIGQCSDLYVTEFLNSLAASKSPYYAKSIWSHLRAVFHQAVKVGALDRCPMPEPVKAPAVPVEVYRENELGPIFMAFTAGGPQLQVAFICAVNFGPRSEDLFGLTWDCFDFKNDPPTVTYTAQKTGKLQTVPLADCTVWQVERLASGRRLKVGPLFPELTAPGSKQPNRSRAARQRNALAKRLLGELGIHVQKPWQVARATANTRYESHSPGSGRFILGHSLSDVNSRSYFEPSRVVIEAVMTLPQPEEFLKT